MPPQAGLFRTPKRWATVLCLLMAPLLLLLGDWLNVHQAPFWMLAVAGVYYTAVLVLAGLGLGALPSLRTIFSRQPQAQQRQAVPSPDGAPGQHT